MSFKIGIVDVGGAAWPGGTTYTRMLLHSFAIAGERALTLFTDQSSWPERIGDLRIDRRPLSASELGGRNRIPKWIESRHLRRAVDLGERALTRAFRGTVFDVARREKISVLLPLLNVPERALDPPVIGWVPDFQHVHLPQYFSAAERERRDRTIRTLVLHARRMMTSSQSAKQDLLALHPGAENRTHVVPFPSMFAFERPTGDVRSTLDKYHLPPRFALVVNQLWQHKNHEIVVRAVRLACDAGVDVPVVMAGLPADHRDPTNETVSRLLQLIASEGVHDRVIVLGRVATFELTDLLRSCVVLIQPSRFEGWSTSVQDALALGRPVICSDLPVHHEQAADAIGFFGCDDPEALARTLVARWTELPPGPQPDVESRALDAAAADAGRHGDALRRLCMEAAYGNSD